MKDLYKHLKGTKQKPSKKDFKESTADLFEKFLKLGSLTIKEKSKVYRIFAKIKIELKDF